ncbi:acetyl-CoA carboxylase biotin carboxylase subunit family protein [Streptacidiphilus sp. MAP5-52]|uniref:ATP-grasp domain-containing protein n=1 Tax=Streptacidiphilus sp. MAP5-52 TaxID=3156267 RepID=UPI003512B47B
MTTTTRPEALLAIGTGNRDAHLPYLDAAARQRPVVLVTAKQPSWQLPHLHDHAVTDLDDLGALRAAVTDLATRHTFVGLTTWDEHALIPTAQIATDLGLPSNSLAAVTASRDTLMARTIWTGHGIPAPATIRVTRLTAATTYARRIGYPVVLKPAAHTPGVAGIKVDDDAHLRAAFRRAAQAAAQGPDRNGVLIEQHRDGTVVTVLCVTEHRQATAVAVARTITRAESQFRATGHLVIGDDLLLDEIGPVAEQALETLGVTCGIGQVTIRLTVDGPHVVEATVAPDRHLLALLVQLATGIELPKVAVDLALGGGLSLEPSWTAAAAAVRLAPGTNAAPATAVSSKLGDPAWLKRLTWADASRSAAAGAVTTGGGDHFVVTGDDEAECLDRLSLAAGLMHGHKAVGRRLTRPRPA